MFKKRFTKEERKKLNDILAIESMQIMKRPIFIVGMVIMMGLIMYFLLRGLGYSQFGLPKTGDMVSTVVGLGAGILTVWLLCKWLKMKNLLWFIIFWGVWMLIFGLSTAGQESGRIQWEYLIYAALAFFGYVSAICETKDHFIEKIFQQEKEKATNNNV